MKREDLEAYAKETSLDLTKFGRALDLRSHPLERRGRREGRRRRWHHQRADVRGRELPSLGPPSFAKLKKLVERALSDKPSSPATTKPSGKPGAKDPPPDPPSGTAKFTVADLAAGTGKAGPRRPAIRSPSITGELLNGGEFDSSYKRSPFTFTLGQGMVIKGWEIGLVGMRTGGRRRLTVPPELGYGNHGSGSILPNATLVFDIELLNVQ